MRVIVAGSRNINDYNKVVEILNNSPFEITEVVCGDARGVDHFGDVWASTKDIPIIHFPAEWDLYGKRAGYLRNVEMANYADALIAIWDGKSKGTMHMINIANKKGLKVHVKII